MVNLCRDENDETGHEFLKGEKNTGELPAQQACRVRRFCPFPLLAQACVHHDRRRARIICGLRKGSGPLCSQRANQIPAQCMVGAPPGWPKFCRLKTLENRCTLMAVYKKTQKGMNELLARTPDIDARLVSVLILVDGVREASEVNRLAQEAGLPVDALEILLHGGFIDRKFKGSAAPADAKIDVRAEPEVPIKPAKTSQLQKFNSLYAYLVEETKALLGLRGFIFQLRIERASTPMELKDLIEPIGKAIEKKHGFKLAKNFLRESERLAVAMIAGRDL